MEKAMATHSSTLAWKILWTEESGRLQSMGSLRVGHNWATSLSLFTFMHWRRKWQPTPVFLPGESQGQRSLGGLPSMGSHRVGHDWSDLAAAAAAVWWKEGYQGETALISQVLFFSICAESVMLFLVFTLNGNNRRVRIRSHPFLLKVWWEIMKVVSFSVGHLD